MQWNIIQPLKNVETLPLVNDMGGLWRHYAKGNKSEKDKYVSPHFICGIWKTNKPVEKDIRLGVTRDGEWSEGELE